LDGFSYDTFTFLLFCSTQLRLLNYFRPTPRLF
jgi:hypothetical protein